MWPPGFDVVAQTILIAEVIFLPCHSLLYRQSPGNIRLTAGVLDQFLWFHAPIRSLSVGRHIFDEKVENRIENNRGDNKQNETEHDGESFAICRPRVVRRLGFLSGPPGVLERSFST